MYKLSSKGFKLISESENLELSAYLDKTGVPTIGYGTTKLNGFPVALGMVINEPVAVALLYGNCNELITYFDKALLKGLNQNQVDALCSLAYNIGVGNFINSTLVIAINHKLQITEDLFTRWNKSHVNGQLVELPGLTARRKKEFLLFTSQEL